MNDKEQKIIDLIIEKTKENKLVWGEKEKIKVPYMNCFYFAYKCLNFSLIFSLTEVKNFLTIEGRTYVLNEYESIYLEKLINKENILEVKTEFETKENDIIFKLGNL